MSRPRQVDIRSGWMLLLVCAMMGCSQESESYPPNLHYPLRTDPLVITAPTSTPAGPYEAGKLDESILTLASQPGARLLNPKDLPTADRDAIAHQLIEKFGTPSTPLVQHADAAALGLTPDRLSAGSKLFRRHCAQCHGLSGDGRGPTGYWITPTPRDFRVGAFKFVSTTGSGPRKAHRQDLLRTLKHGLPGTAMPAFGMLGDETLLTLIDYVRHLSIRGEVEFQLMHMGILHEWDGTIAEATDEELQRIIDGWKTADNSRIAPTIAVVPDDDAIRLATDHLDSIRRGEKLFLAKDGAGCLACHENYGRASQWRYDIWGTPVRPANLTEPIYKGGKQPTDFFWRVRCGIAPSGMPIVPHLNEADVWDVVHFVQALPYPRMLPPDVRARVYTEQSSGSAPDANSK